MIVFFIKCQLLGCYCFFIKSSFWAVQKIGPVQSTALFANCIHLSILPLSFCYLIQIFYVGLPGHNYFLEEINNKNIEFRFKYLSSLVCFSFTNTMTMWAHFLKQLSSFFCRHLESAKYFIFYILLWKEARESCFTVFPVVKSLKEKFPGKKYTSLFKHCTKYI